MKIHPLIGHKVSAAHPRGGERIAGVVVKVEREEGRGMVATLHTGMTVTVNEARKSDEPLPAAYASTYCNHPHSMTSGKPIAHECYHIPPAALRLERHGLFTEAIGIMESVKAGAPR